MTTREEMMNPTLDLVNSLKAPSHMNNVTNKVAARLKRAEKEESKLKVRMGNSELKNVFHFTYLGHFFQADGDTLRGIQIREAKADSRFSKLEHIWESKVLSKNLKLQLYQSVVASTFSHCHEAWKLDETAIKKIGGWNSRRLSIITGRTQRQERVRPTWNIVMIMRMRRLKWLGHILRLDDDRMLKQAILSMKKPYPEGSILMDAPPHDSIQELVDLAGDHGWENHKEWTSYVKEFSKNFVEFPDEVSSDDTSDVEDTTENSDSDWD